MRSDTPSRTAIIVTKAQALVGASPGLSELVQPEAQSFIHEALRTAGHSRFVRALKSPSFRKLQYGLQALTIPGLALHQVLRKRLIEERVIAAIEGGAKEVIQIGAELDSLCYRLHQKWPLVHFREFDHPATQSLKERVIQKFGSIQKNFTRHPIDLGNPGSELEGFTTDNGHARIVIAEGVLMYLPPKRISILLHQWRKEFGESARLLFTFFSEKGFENQRPLVNTWLRQIGEPFRWWADDSEFRALLKESGWSSPRIISTDDPGRTRGLRHVTIARGEWIAETKANPQPSLLEHPAG